MQVRQIIAGGLVIASCLLLTACGETKTLEKNGETVVCSHHTAAELEAHRAKTQPTAEPTVEPEETPVVTVNPTECDHEWHDITTEIEHPAETKTVHHDAVTERKQVWTVDKAAYSYQDPVYTYTCKVCGTVFTTYGSDGNDAREQGLAKMENHMLVHDPATVDGLITYSFAETSRTIEVPEAGHYETKLVTTTEAWDEIVEISAAWTETVVTGQECSICGITR